MHWIGDGWQFNGDVNKPTFTPSVKITGKQKIVVDGKWSGGWVRGPDGAPVDFCCHYILTNGVLNFCGDCTHKLKNSSVPLPALPAWFCDDS